MPPRPKTTTVFIDAQGIETIPEEYCDEQGVTQIRRLVRGSVNGQSFSVECNKHVKVPVEVAEVLRSLMNKQSEGE